jgi:hypothetical protein
MLDVMDTRQNKRLSATERGEPQRSGGEPNGGANNRAADSPATGFSWPCRKAPSARTPSSSTRPP